MTRILRVLAPNPSAFTLEGTNTWIVGRGPSIVIDPGPDDPSHLLSVLDEAAPIAAIVLTHHHPDHAPGAARLAQAAATPILAFRPEGGEQSLADGSILRGGGVELRVLHTPGHTEDHVCLFVDETGALFTGDTVLGRGTSIVDPPEGDMTAYVRSLERLHELRPRTVYPGHGPAIFDGHAKIEEYLEHRAMREAQVLAALAEREATPEAIVPGIYGDEIPAELFPAAARSVLAHLMKLEKEGKAARTGQPGEDRFRSAVPRACKRCGRPALAGSRFCGRCAVSALQEGP